MQRSDGRRRDQMRPVTIVRHYLQHPEGAVLIQVGGTEVICTASVEDERPRFMKTQNIRNKGWVTAEYSMLPRSTHDRMQREVTRGQASGRTQEIQRLIGRSMRAVTDLKELGERTIWIDCDVIQADGGTRTASITGGYVALYLAILDLVKKNKIDKMPAISQIAAVSVGILEHQVLLDLCYEEDSGADADFNIVMNRNSDFIEVQGTAEHRPYSKKLLEEVLYVATNGIKQLFAIQNEVISKMTQNSS